MSKKKTINTSKSSPKAQDKLSSKAQDKSSSKAQNKSPEKTSEKIAPKIPMEAPSGMFSKEINEEFKHAMMVSDANVGQITPEVKQKTWEKIGNYFRANSLWMLMYCTGCCAIELPQAMTSRYDMERLGMGPMATPRQADILLITGYLSLKTLRRLVYTYEQMSEPKYVVGFGPCTINGGIYHDSHAVINQLDQYVPIDLYIAGCMPKPEAVMNGFKDLITLIESGKATGWKDYHVRYDWYKQNQQEALGEVMIHDEYHE